MDNKNKGPWGGNDDQPSPSQPSKSPWGGKDNEDVDALLRDAQNRFKKSFGNGGGPSFPIPGAGRGLGFLFLAALVIWISTGLYRVQPSEDAVIMTFGKWTGTKTDAGLGYHLPWPVQDVQKVDVALDRRIIIGFRDGGSVGNPDNTDVSFESQMLTGDENIININFVVLWHIADAGKYLFQIRDPESTIKKVAESAMREIIGRTPIQKALTEARGEVETKTRELMQKVLDEYQAGVSIAGVQLQNVNPPAPVVDAFDDVQRARADKERLKNEAETYTNDILPKARGEAQKTVQEAEAYKQAVIDKAQGDAARFVSIYESYAQSRDITEKRIYIETMEEILKNGKKVILSDDKTGTLLPYIPLNGGALPATDKK